MVTIEQKLTLFSKLLNQDIKEEIDKKIQELDKEYEKIIVENRFRIDKQASGIIEQAKRKAETKKVELISKGKLSYKKESMLIKEKIIKQFMSALEEKIKIYVQTGDYRKYLKRLVSTLDSLNGYSNALVVYLTSDDFEKHQEFIKEEFIKLGVNPSLLSFKVVKENILGGVIIEVPVLNMRIDESIKTLLEEQKDGIIEKITVAIGEVGDQLE